MNRRPAARSRSYRSSSASSSRSASRRRTTSTAQKTSFAGPFALFIATLCCSYVFFSFQGWGKVNQAKTMEQNLTARLTSARDAVDALEKESSGFLSWIARKGEEAAAEEAAADSEAVAQVTSNEQEGA